MVTYDTVLEALETVTIPVNRCEAFLSAMRFSIVIGDEHLFLSAALTVQKCCRLRLQDPQKCPEDQNFTRDGHVPRGGERLRLRSGVSATARLLSFPPPPPVPPKHTTICGCVSVRPFVAVSLTRPLILLKSPAAMGRQLEELAGGHAGNNVVTGSASGLMVKGEIHTARSNPMGQWGMNPADLFSW